MGVVAQPASPMRIPPIRISCKTWSKPFMRELKERNVVETRTGLGWSKSAGSHEFRTQSSHRAMDFKGFQGREEAFFEESSLKIFRLSHWKPRFRKPVGWGGISHGGRKRGRQRTEWGSNAGLSSSALFSPLCEILGSPMR
jgi:hypothetical protein